MEVAVGVSGGELLSIIHDSYLLAPESNTGGCRVRGNDRDSIDGDVIIRSKDGTGAGATGAVTEGLMGHRGIMGSNDHLVVHPIIISFEG